MFVALPSCTHIPLFAILFVPSYLGVCAIVTALERGSDYQNIDSPGYLLFVKDFIFMYVIKYNSCNI